MILSSVLPACPPAMVLQHVLFRIMTRESASSYPESRGILRTRGTGWTAQGGGGARKECGEQILRGDEALGGEIRALLHSAVLPAAIPASHSPSSGCTWGAEPPCTCWDGRVSPECPCPAPGSCSEQHQHLPCPQGYRALGRRRGCAW